MTLSPWLLVGSTVLADAPAAPPAGQVQPAPAAPPVAQVQPVKDRMVCRMEEETGSLVRKRRTCLTAKQWASSQEEARKEAERLQTRPSPNLNN